MTEDIQAMAPGHLLRKHRALARDLRAAGPLAPVRVALLGSSTTREFQDLLELLLLAEGLDPTFHEGAYDRFYEEAVLAPEPLAAFDPDVAIVYTGTAALRAWPALAASEADLEAALDHELARFQAVWESLQRHTRALVVQTTFEPPAPQGLGSLDAAAPGGRLRFCRALNERFARAAQANPRLALLDQAGVVEAKGRAAMLDPRRWFQAKLLTTPEGSLDLAKAAAALVRAARGRARKVLVLDLDNTLWGGVIGDDGLARLRLGREHPEGEAYLAFQAYCKRLKERGILLAVCSKNDEAVARQGFEHPDALLQLSDFAAFKANWQPKSENLAAIARELDLGLDSFVFADDNPAERHEVRSALPQVAVPDLGSEVEGYIPALEAGRHFESLGLSAEDFARSSAYAANRQRQEAAGAFQDYGAYLDSLAMRAEIRAWDPPHLDRITQLCGKTNQYNLTTRRYSQGEVEAIAADPACVALYGRLRDAFGDNGLVSVLVGRIEGGVCDLETWLMSCRVLKRDLEHAMLDALVAICQARGVRELLGRYLPTPKNALVADHYARLGFERLDPDGAGASRWRLALAGYQPRNRHIREVVYD